MKVFVSIHEPKTQKDITNLHKTLKSTRLKEVLSVELEQAPTEAGAMSGAGAVINSVGVAFSSASAPLVELVKTLQKYVESFRTEIVLKNAGGDELVLSTKKIDKEAIDRLVETFILRTKNIPVTPPAAEPPKRGRPKKNAIDS